MSDSDVRLRTGMTRFGSIHAQLSGAPVVYPGNGTISKAAATLVATITGGWDRMPRVGDHLIVNDRIYPVAAVSGNSVTLDGSGPGGDPTNLLMGPSTAVAPAPQAWASHAVPEGTAIEFHVPVECQSPRLVVLGLNADATPGSVTVDGVALASCGEPVELTVPTSSSYACAFCSEVLEPGAHSVSVPSGMERSISMVVSGAWEAPTMWSDDDVSPVADELVATIATLPASPHIIGVWRGVIPDGVTGFVGADQSEIGNEGDMVAISAAAAAGLTISYTGSVAASAAFGVVWGRASDAALEAVQSGRYDVIVNPAQTEYHESIFGNGQLCWTFVEGESTAFLGAAAVPLSPAGRPWVSISATKPTMVIGDDQESSVLFQTDGKTVTNLDTGGTSVLKVVVEVGSRRFYSTGPEVEAAAT